MSLQYGSFRESSLDSVESGEYTLSGYELGVDMESDEDRVLVEENDTSGHNYANVVRHIFNRQANSINISPENTLAGLHQISKKRLREIIADQNNKAMKFLFKDKACKQSSPLNYAEILCKRFGSDVPLNTCVSLSKDINLSNDSDKAFEQINNIILREGKSNIREIVSQLRCILNEYKKTGEEIILQEAKLSRKLEVMTKLNERVASFASLPSNENLKTVMDSFSVYMKTEFDKLDIETGYNDLVEEYKKWNLLRQIISLQSMFSFESCVPECAICMTEKVTHVLVPCGHTICSGCMKNVTTSCYICRGSIRERVKLYYT